MWIIGWARPGAGRGSLRCPQTKRVPTALVEIAIQLGPGDLALSGVADAKLRSDAREWMAVYGCGRALVAAVVAATVAVGDTGGPSAPEAGSQPFAIAMGERRCSDLS